ncbi:MAG: hypothetical protein EA351_12140 [Gemmatimonadales bacterium]|nr:MAG: hypothetical protein EA351_12140 [Gemmatimonadales bacterium]
MKKQWFIAIVVIFAVLGSLAFVQAQGGNSQESEAAAAQDYGPSGQPIAFPHNTHAGEYQIDCQYCHFSAERASSAGVPPVASCMGCHTAVAGPEGGEEIPKLRGYWERGEAIPWNRIYKVADHVQFPHMRHVSAGVDCAACHGNLEEIGVIQRVEQPLTMGWCLNCHIDMGASRDCTVCHY